MLKKHALLDFHAVTPRAHARERQLYVFATGPNNPTYGSRQPSRNWALQYHCVCGSMSACVHWNCTINALLLSHRTGAALALALHWHCTSTAQALVRQCTGTGAALALGLRCTETTRADTALAALAVLALRWQCTAVARTSTELTLHGSAVPVLLQQTDTGTALALHWHFIVSALTLDCCTDSALTLHWQCTDRTEIVRCRYTASALPLH